MVGAASYFGSEGVKSGLWGHFNQLRIILLVVSQEGRTNFHRLVGPDPVSQGDGSAPQIQNLAEGQQLGQVSRLLPGGVT